MKTNEELKVLKAQIETLGKKLAGLSEEELDFVTGGGICGYASKGEVENPFDNLPKNNPSPFIVGGKLRDDE